MISLVSEDAEPVDNGDAVAISGSLAAMMMAFEVGTAVAGQLLGIDPYNQPDVESAKNATRELLASSPEPSPAEATDGSIEIRGSEQVLQGATTVPEALKALLGQLPEDGYVSVQAYFDRLGWAELEKIRPVLAEKTGRPVTFGWAPGSSTRPVSTTRAAQLRVSTCRSRPPRTRTWTSPRSRSRSVS